MLAMLASAALIAGGALALGQALLALGTGRREWTWLSGPVGFALLLAAAAIVARLGGGGAAIAVVLGVLALAGAIVALRVSKVPASAAPALLAGALAALFVALPFIAAGDVGLLGVGLVNDDMAAHLLLADWIDERFRPEPVLVDQGYPLGPHALVAGLVTVLDAGSIDVFAGLVLAVPALMALAAYAALAHLRPAARVLASVLAATPYLLAAYLAQEAFKEPILALFLVAFALLLPTVRSPREAIPLGVLAAGVVYVYSFPGLAWLAGTLVAWAALRALAGSRQRGGAGGGGPFPPMWRTTSLTFAAGAAALALLLVPEIPRLLDFADFRALDPDRANEGGLGNLRGHISPLEALGIWPTSDFRVSAASAGAPAALFYLGATLAALALALALPRWLARHGPAIPAALIAAVLLYLAGRGFGTVYTSAKALAIAAPLVALITFGGLFPEGRLRLEPHRLLVAAVALAAAGSSFLVLRQAPVGPAAHMRELAQIRPLVAGEKLLFLGRDNFILYELRGSKPHVAVRNFYVPRALYVEPNTELRDAFSKFDFDSVSARTLARFPYVLTTSAAYQSGPPPEYEVAARTPSYVLYERRGSPLGREPGEDDASPGSLGGCPGTAPKRLAAFERTPVVRSRWSDATIESGEEARLSLALPRGSWRLSLQYDASRPLTLAASDFEHRLPGNLDYRGSVPFHDAGTLETGGGRVELVASVEQPPLLGRLLGARAVAHLGSVAAVRAGDPRAMDPRRGCAAYVDWYVSG